MQSFKTGNAASVGSDCRYCSDNHGNFDLPICDNCSDWELLCNLAEDADNGFIFKWRIVEIAEDLWGTERTTELVLHRERRQ